MDSLIRPDLQLYVGQSGSALVNEGRRCWVSTAQRWREMRSSPCRQRPSIEWWTPFSNGAMCLALFSALRCRPFLCPKLCVRTSAKGSTRRCWCCTWKPNAPAAAAGILVGDLVLSVDGHLVHNVHGCSASAIQPEGWRSGCCGGDPRRRKNGSEGNSGGSWLRITNAKDRPGQRPGLARLERFVVLPCVDSMIHASRFAALRAARELDLLPVALPSTLLFRVQSDSPDVIVIAEGEAFLARARQPQRTRGSVFRHAGSAACGRAERGNGAQRGAYENIFRASFGGHHASTSDRDRSHCGGLCGHCSASACRAGRRDADYGRPDRERGGGFAVDGARPDK